jgi:hypothetical protein
MVTLHWERLSAGRWRLVDGDANVWALVEPPIDERTGEPVKPGGRGIFARAAFKAAMAADPHRVESRWTTGHTPAQAKRRAEDMLRRWQWQDFEVIADVPLPEPRYIPTAAGLRAIGATWAPLGCGSV